MKKIGIVDWFIDNALELYTMYKSDYRSQTTNGGRTAYGRGPISFSQFASDYKQNGLSWSNQLNFLTGWLKFE